MTCIAALVGGDGTGYIAFDSLGSNRITKNVYKTNKIFRRGSFLIGFTGSYRLGQILEYQLVIPARKVDQTLEHFLHIDFVDAVRAALEAGGFDRHGEFLFIVDGRIFTMQSDSSLLESVDTFEACGSGEDYARAAMRTLVNHTSMNPADILTEAITTAANYVPSVGGDIHHMQCPEPTPKPATTRKRR